jgi:hypothetical protein
VAAPARPRVEPDSGRQVGGAEPKLQGVGVVAAAFPQPPARAGRDQQQAGRVGGGLAALGLVGGPHLLQVGLVPPPGLLVLLDGGAVAPPAAALLAHETGQQGQRAEQGHGQVQRLAQGDRQAGAEDGRQDGGQQPEPRAVALAGLLRHGQAPGPAGRQQPRRAVVDQPAVVGRGQRGVGRLRPVQAEQGRPDGHDAALRPAHPALDRRAVEHQRHVRRRLHGGARRADLQGGRARRHRRVGEGHRAAGVAAQLEPPEPQPVDGAGGRAAGHAHLDHPGRLGQAGGRPVPGVQGHHHAVAEQPGGGQLAGEASAVGPEAVRVRGGAGRRGPQRPDDGRSGPAGVGQGAGDVPDGVALLEGDDHVRATAVEGAEHRQRRLHRELQPPRSGHNRSVTFGTGSYSKAP